MYKLITEFSNYHPIQTICNSLDIIRSVYYAYRKSLIHHASEEKRKLIAACADHLLWLTPELQEQGYSSVRRHHLRRLIHQEELRAIQPRSFIPRTADSRHSGPFSRNLLLNSALLTAPGGILGGYITYILFNYWKVGLLDCLDG